MRALTFALVLAVGAVGCDADDTTDNGASLTDATTTPVALEGGGAMNEYRDRAIPAIGLAQDIYNDVAAATAEGEGTTRAYCDGALLDIPDIEDGLGDPPDERLSQLTDRFIEALTTALELCAGGDFVSATTEIGRSRGFITQMTERLGEL